MTFELSPRIRNLPPYLFAEIDRKKQELKKKGVSLIDLSIGDPDILAPEGVIDTLCTAARKKENQKYALDEGKLALRITIKEWFKKRFGVSLNEEEEILPLIGSKEGLVHFPLALVNRGDYVIVPSPAYPAYKSAAILAEANVYELPLRESNHFLPDLEEIPLSIRNKAKLIYLNYPNNPTTVLSTQEFLRNVINFCSHYGVVIAYDNAYSEIYFEKKPLSILEIEEARCLTCEFHSFSKTFCMTGFRLGWAVGNKELIKALKKVKVNIDSGVFGAIQEAGAYALQKEEKYVDKLRKEIKKRKDLFIEGLKHQGMMDVYAESTFYIWAKIPSRFRTSLEFTEYLLDKGVVVTAGIGFGRYGEGFVRFALTLDEDDLTEALKKMEV